MMGIVLAAGDQRRAALPGLSLQKGWYPLSDFAGAIARLAAQFSLAGLSKMVVVCGEAKESRETYLSRMFPDLDTQHVYGCGGNGDPFVSLMHGLSGLRLSRADDFVIAVSDHVFGGGISDLIGAERRSADEVLFGEHEGAFAGCVKCGFSFLEFVTSPANNKKKAAAILAKWRQDGYGQLRGIEVAYADVGSVDAYAEYVTRRTAPTGAVFGRPELTVAVTRQGRSTSTQLFVHGQAVWRQDLDVVAARESEAGTRPVDYSWLLPVLRKVELKRVNPTTENSVGVLDDFPGVGNVFVKFSPPGISTHRLRREAAWNFFVSAMTMSDSAGTPEFVPTPVFLCDTEQGTYHGMRWLRNAVPLSRGYRQRQDDLFGQVVLRLIALHGYRGLPGRVPSREPFVHRLQTRVAELKGRLQPGSELYDVVYGSHRVVVNGIGCVCFSDMLRRLGEDSLLGRLDAMGFGLIHGDPQLENILTNDEGAFFVDPSAPLREMPIAYDLGKIGLNVLGNLEELRGTAANTVSRVGPGDYRLWIETAPAALEFLIRSYADFAGKTFNETLETCRLAAVYHLVSASPHYLGFNDRALAMVLTSMYLFAGTADCGLGPSGVKKREQRSR